MRPGALGALPLAFLACSANDGLEAVSVPESLTPPVEWTALFNGRDLTAWTPAESHPVDFRRVELAVLDGAEGDGQGDADELR